MPIIVGEDGNEMFVPESQERLVQLLADCKLSMETFCKTFMPDTFWRGFSSLHREIFRVLDDESIKQVAIAAPRGFGKTSILNMAFPLQHILFRTKKYIVTVSATENSAVEQSENMKRELLENEVISELFGSFKTAEFAKQGWVTKSKTKVLPRGAGQQIRGRKYMRHRPDLFVIDDLENDESVRSEDQRDLLKRWFYSSVVNSVDRGKPGWRIVVGGTILHEDSLLANLLEDPEWYSLRLELFDDNYHSNWPDFLTDEGVKELVDGYRQRNLLDVLYMEYRNLPISLENQGFKQEHFKYYNKIKTEQELNVNPDIIGVVLADPAKTHKAGSAQTAVVGLSVDRGNTDIYVRDIVEAQMSPDELYKEMLDMAERINALVIAPETTSLHEYITLPLQNAINERGKFYHIVEVKPREGKTGPKRSAGLIPMYRAGHVYHNENCCGALERYLLMWPKPNRWDIIDAVSSIIYVMEDGEVYFSPEDYDVEEEYEEIQNEPAMSDEWMIA